jgi:hypothetical protein
MTEMMLEYTGRKLFFPGDLMDDGWKELLKRNNFETALKGTDFFITAHHGHKSGYTPEIYEVIGEGKPLINIVSEKSGGEVHSVYSDSEHAEGIERNGETRRMFSTRRGSIFITVYNDSSYDIDQKELEDNISQ